MKNEIQLEFVMAMGLPCSGKTTHYNKIYKDRGYVQISTDQYIEEYAKSLGKTYSEVFWDKKAFVHAEQRMKNSLEYALQNGLNIYWDQTNMTAKSRRKKLAKIPDNYKRVGLVFEVSDATLAERNQLRGQETGKVIPTKVIETMKQAWEHPDFTEFSQIDKVI